MKEDDPTQTLYEKFLIENASLYNKEGVEIEEWDPKKVVITGEPVQLPNGDWKYPVKYSEN